VFEIGAVLTQSLTQRDDIVGVLHLNHEDATEARGATDGARFGQRAASHIGIPLSRAAVG